MLQSINEVQMLLKEQLQLFRSWNDQSKRSNVDIISRERNTSNETQDGDYHRHTDDHRSNHVEPTTKTSRTFWRPVSRQSQDHDDKFTIPLDHRTASASLFAFPQIQHMIGKYPENIFLHIESQRTLDYEVGGQLPLTDVLSTIDHQSELTEPLVTQFFSSIHPHLPILDYESFLPIYNTFLRAGAREDSDTSLCLMVLALGQLSMNIHQSQGSTFLIEDGESKLFQSAYRMMFKQWSVTIIPKLSLLMSLVYGALYLCYLFRPLQAWKLTHMASTSLQTMISG